MMKPKATFEALKGMEQWEAASMVRSWLDTGPSLTPEDFPGDHTAYERTRKRTSRARSTALAQLLDLQDLPWEPSVLARLLEQGGFTVRTGQGLPRLTYLPTPQAPEEPRTALAQVLDWYNQELRLRARAGRGKA